MTGRVLVAAATAALAVLLAMHSADAGSTLVVVSPTTLAQAFNDKYPPIGDIPDAPAMFGIPFYGQSQTGLLVYADPPTGCTAIDSDNFPDPSDGYLTILLIDRGGDKNCTFVKKVKNCQAAGAVACVIADSQTSPNAQLPVMGDDGTATAALQIPSVIISNADATAIKQSMAAGSQVVMTVTFSLPNPDGHVEWEYWTSSNDPDSHTFKHEFLPAIQQLGDSHTFTPHYYILDGNSPANQCVHPPPGWTCGLQCTNGGRYCAIDPELDLKRGKDGEDVIKENVRQMCVYQYLTSVNQTVKWWEYVNIFTDTCGQSDATWNATCSDAILTQLQLPTDTIGACVADSGGFGDNVNTLLEAELALRRTRFIYHFPQLVINNEYYWGSLACPQPLQLSSCGVLRALCSAFLPGTSPPACNGDDGCAIGVKRDICDVCGGNGEYDACGVCLSPSLPTFNQSCAGCDGVPNSGIQRDACGVCGGKGRVDACGMCLDPALPAFNQSCAGCDGVPNSGVQRDACGVCGGKGRLDACGVCLDPALPAFNQSCIGCDGVPNSNFTRDACGKCLKRTDLAWVRDPTLCAAAVADPPSGGVSLGIVVAVSVVGLAVLGGAVFFFVRRSKQQTQQDVANLLRQYVPLDADAKTIERYRNDKQQPLAHTSETAGAPVAGDLSAAQLKAVERASLLSDQSAAGVAGTDPMPPAPVDEL